MVPKWNYNIKLVCHPCPLCLQCDCFFHTVTLSESPKRWERDQTLPTAFSEGKHAQLTVISLAVFVGDDDKEESVEEIRKFKKSRKRKKFMVMCDG